MTAAGWPARALLVAWLAAMWVLLWGELTGPNVLGGLLIGLGVVLVFPPQAVRDDPLRVHPLGALALAAWFAQALVVSNLAVAREVIAPGAASRITTAVVAVPLRVRSGRLATIVANLITLTPGTLTIDARGRPAVLFVHVLSFESVEATRAEVADLERLVVRAFGSAEDLARIDPAPLAIVGGESGS